VWRLTDVATNGRHIS